jgi:hypothetical protein
MPNEEKMTLEERRKYLRLIKKRYLKASTLERGRMLDEMEAGTCLHRQSPICLMSGQALSRTRSLRHPPTNQRRQPAPQRGVVLLQLPPARRVSKGENDDPVVPRTYHDRES